MLSPLVFDLEHEQARRIQLAQTEDKVFEVRVDLTDDADARLVFEQVIQKIKRVFHDNGLDVAVREGQTAPQLTASGKFHEVLPLQGSTSSPNSSR